MATKNLQVKIVLVGSCCGKQCFQYFWKNEGFFDLYVPGVIDCYTDEITVDGKRVTTSLHHTRT